MFSIGPVQQETGALQVSCYIFCKKTTIYVLDYFFSVVDKKPRVSRSFFFPSSYYVVSTEQKAISVSNLGCYEYFRSLHFSWNKRKPLKFSMCIAEMNSICFFSKATWGWPKSLSPLHKYIENLREHVGYRKLFKEIATKRKKELSPNFQVWWWIIWPYVLSKFMSFQNMFPCVSLRFHRVEQAFEIAVINLGSLCRISNRQTFNILMLYLSFPFLQFPAPI